METGFWGFVIIGGPILLGLVLIFVMLSNRRRRDPRDIARTEQATRDLHREMNAEDRPTGG